MTSTSNKTLIAILALFAVITPVTADYYYNNQGSTLSSQEALAFPGYDSQQEIMAKLVAPFIFVAALLNVALSKALVFILAKDDSPDYSDEEYLAFLPYAFQVRDNQPDVRRYSMVMSLAITASIIPTPYWDVITGLMTTLGVTAVAGLVIVSAYIVYSALT